LGVLLPATHYLLRLLPPCDDEGAQGLAPVR